MDDLLIKVRNGIYKKGKIYGIICDVVFTIFIYCLFIYIVGTGLDELLRTGL